jgi:AcrR family transcriptional regulator
MGTNERRAREREARRRAILEAARTLFAQQGVEATSMDALAARAELAKGTLYLYFKSKEELLIAMLEEDLGQLRAAAQMLDQAPSAQAALELLLPAAVAFYRRRPTGFMPLLRAPGRAMDEFLRVRLAKQRDAMLEIIAGLVRRGQAQGELRASYDAAAVARLLWANFIGAISLYETGGVDDLEAQLATFAAIVRQGLAIPDDQRPIQQET